MTWTDLWTIILFGIVGGIVGVTAAPLILGALGWWLTRRDEKRARR